MGNRAQDPMVALSSSIPYIGSWLSLWVGFMGLMICYVSTNTGVIGVSRVTFSMGRLGLAPNIFRKVHKKYYTPYITIIIFPLIAVAIIVANIFTSSLDLLEIVASLYNFGALISYMYVNLALIFLRKESGSGWRVPGTMMLSLGKRKVEIPLLPLIGFISCFAIWLLMVYSHEVGRFLGFAWFTIGVVIFYIMRRSQVRKSSG